MRSFPMRALSCAVLSTLVLAVSGCSWLRGPSVYENASEGRALEVPPDLDSPRADPAMAIPAVGPATGSPRTSVAAPTIVASGPFPVSDTVESTWRRLGIALERTDGVEIVERAQVLSAYSVRFGGSEFLIRVSRDGDGSRVGAVDADGREVTGGEAGRLLAALRKRLS
jgi:uncharacterized lipoprotein